MAERYCGDRKRARQSGKIQRLDSQTGSLPPDTRRNEVVFGDGQIDASTFEGVRLPGAYRNE